MASPAGLSSTPPVVGSPSYATSPPSASLLPGASVRQRRIAWCPQGALFPGAAKDDNADDGGERPRGGRAAPYFVLGLPELKLYEYLGNNQNASHNAPPARLLAIHSDYALLTKHFAWSPSPSTPDLIAIAQGTGKVVLVKLGMFTWLSTGPIGIGGAGPVSDTFVPPARPDTPPQPAQGTPAQQSSPAPAAAPSTFSTLTSFIRSSLSSSPPTAPPAVQPPALSSAKLLAEFSPKHPRACNAVAFSPDGRYLAAGYEKVRNDAGVYVWDLEARGDRAPAAQSQLAKSLAGTTTAPAAPHPFAGAHAQPLGPADPVVSLAFLSPHLLVAGVPGKGIRGWDLRHHTSGAPSFAIATKSIHGLAADPWNPYRVAGYGDDGAVRIFDVRRGALAAHAPYPVPASSEPLLALPTADVFPKGVAQLSWSLARSGMLAASGVGAGVVRLWDVREAGGGPAAESGLESQPVVWRTKTIRTGKTGAAVTGLCFVPPLVSPPREGSPEPEAGEPPTPAAGKDAEHGSTAHRILASLSDDTMAVLDVREAQRNAWGARGGNEMAWVGGRGVVVVAEGIRAADSKAGVMAMGPGTAVGEMDAPAVLGMDVGVVMRERARAGYGVEPSANLAVFAKDPGPFGNDLQHLSDLWSFLATSKELATSGAARLGDRDWSFAGVGEVLEDALKGSNGTPKALPISEQAPSAPTLPRDNPRQGLHRNMSMPAFGSLLDQSLREGFLEVAADMESLPSDQRAAKVVIGEEHKRLALAMCGWGSPHPGSSSGDNGVDEELEDALHTMELGGHYEKAAGWALFRGASLGRAIKCLRSSNEERLKLVAVALSAALPTGTNPTTDSAGILARGGFPAVFVDLCSSLATDLQDPYLRAMFALVANGGDWHVVLDEKELPLRDRVGVAVRFLSDDQLLSYIKRTRGVMIQSGSIEGILLTGLLSADGQGSTRAKDGIQLLQNHVDRTGDAQTAALCTAMVYPGRVQDRRTDEWVDAYRSLLDRWEMFHERARFDIARGRYANFASWSAKSSVPGTPTLTQVSPRGLSVPPQIAVRCNFCGSGIQHRVATGRKDFKAIACPTCRKPLPRCSLCLMPMGTWPTSLDTVPGGATAGAGLLSAAASPANSPPKTPIAIVSTASRSSIKKAPLDPTSMGPGPTVPSGFDAWFTWCVRCRHGGHNVHVREWFAEHSVCPVTGCGCRCSAL